MIRIPVLFQNLWIHGFTNQCLIHSLFNWLLIHESTNSRMNSSSMCSSMSIFHGPWLMACGPWRDHSVGQTWPRMAWNWPYSRELGRHDYKSISDYIISSIFFILVHASWINRRSDITAERFDTDCAYFSISLWLAGHTRTCICLWCLKRSRMRHSRRVAEVAEHIQGDASTEKMWLRKWRSDPTCFHINPTSALHQRTKQNSFRLVKRPFW